MLAGEAALTVTSVFCHRDYPLSTEDRCIFTAHVTQSHCAMSCNQEPRVKAVVQ
jgi:hypothetical protein